MKTFDIKYCAAGEIVVRLIGKISDYPTTIIFLGKVYNRYAWSYVNYEIYYNQSLHLQAVDAAMEAGDFLATEEYLNELTEREADDFEDAAIHLFELIGATIKC